jgi:hypothetical protein
MSSADDLVVALDYGQFYLRTTEEDPELAVDLLDEAHDADGIAQQGGLVVVESPHQNNFEMPLRVEVWTAPPDGDIEEWEEAYEVHLDVGDDGLTYESPTLGITPLPVPPGSYHVIITGRGFVGYGWPGSTTPGDSWRIRLWPSDGPSRPTRLRSYSQAPLMPLPRSEPQLREAGIAAALRIRAALYRISGLSGETGIAGAQGVVNVDAALLWSHLHRPTAWLTGAGSERDDGFLLRGYDLEPEELIAPPGVDIRCRDLEHVPLISSLTTWQWVRLPDDLLPPTFRHGQPPGALPYGFQPTMTLRFTLHPANQDDAAGVLVDVEHANLPAEWVPDMTTYWRWQLDRLNSDVGLL